MMLFLFHLFLSLRHSIFSAALCWDRCELHKYRQQLSNYSKRTTHCSTIVPLSLELQSGQHLALIQYTNRKKRRRTCKNRSNFLRSCCYFSVQCNDKDICCLSDSQDQQSKQWVDLCKKWKHCFRVFSN